MTAPRDRGGKPVIVAEGIRPVTRARGEFGGADDVVLVNDGNSSRTPERGDGLADVEKALAIVDVFTRQKELTRPQAYGFKRVRPCRGQDRLPRRRRGLQSREVFGTTCHTKRPHAGTHGTAADDGNSPVLRKKLRPDLRSTQERRCPWHRRGR